MDERFAHIHSDPRFRATPKSVRKVKIDKRFQSLFTDKQFQLKYSVDKRGKPVSQSNVENFKKYYELSSEEDSSEEDSNEENEKDSDLESKQLDNDLSTSKTKQKPSLIEKSQQNKWKVTPAKDSESGPGEGDEQEISDLFIKQDKANQKEKKSLDLNKNDKVEKARMTDEIKMKLRDPTIDYARGVGTLLSDSSSEEESSESDSEDEDVEHHWGELDRDAERTEDVTDRLAVLHMDWDRIRAVDLMVLFNSFLPSGGLIKSVTIYPSEFGLKRLKEEEEKGPPELVNIKPNDEDIDEESKDGRNYHMERLRQYQLNRLKYYYAVIQFDSAETANKVYTECDGLEYESSATKLDLRVVPDEETFDQEPHEVCTSMPDPAKYEPRIFTNTALQQGKVELTWDETDPGRREFTKKLQRDVDKIDDADLQAYLASSSGEEDEEENEKKDDKGANDSSEESGCDEKEEDKISKYKSLLASIEEEEEKKKNRDVDLEITWGVGLKEKAEKSIKEKLNAPQTPFEEMLEKRKQNKKLKKEKKLKTKAEQESDDSSNISEDDDIPSDVDMSDPFFKEELQAGKSKKKKKSVLETENEEDKQRQAELELLLMEENGKEEQKSHFNMKQIINMENESTTKRKRRKQMKKKKPMDVAPEKDDFQVDVSDERFSALFNSHHFNIDPAAPHFHKTKAMDTIISEKLKRRTVDVESQGPPSKETKLDPELSRLVSSIKSKTKQKR